MRNEVLQCPAVLINQQLTTYENISSNTNAINKRLDLLINYEQEIPTVLLPMDSCDRIDAGSDGNEQQTNK